MDLVLLTATLILVLLTAAFGLLFSVLNRKRSCPTQSDYENIFSPAVYKPMARLLDRADYDFLASEPACTRDLVRRLRAQRIRIFRRYMDHLGHDFNRICSAIKTLMIQSQADRPDLAQLLMKQRFLFRRSMVSAEFRLVLYGFGLGAVDVGSLLESFDVVRAQLRGLALVPQTTSA